MPEYHGIPDKNFTKNRIESLSDGIFSIVMTLIILELKIPVDIAHNLVDTELPVRLKGMLPQFEMYFVSFFLLGLFWMRHVTQYRYIREVDRVLLWINILFLMFVALVPFSINFLMDYPFHELAFLVYSINLTAIAYMLLIHWAYASYKNLLTDDAEPALIKDINILIVATSLLFTSCIIISFVDVRVGTFMLYLDPILYASYYQYRKVKGSTFMPLGKGRLETLCDAVFAIVMTLMILSLVVPEGISDTSVDSVLPQKLMELLPRFENYFISFIVLGIYWVMHQIQFKYINSADRTLIWINIVFLVFVALIPFVTAVMMSYPDHKLPLIIYCLNLFIIGITVYVHWIYATANCRLTDKDLDPVFRERTARLILIGPAIFMVCMAAAYYDVRVALTLIYLVPILSTLFRNYPKMAYLKDKIASKISKNNK